MATLNAAERVLLILRHQRLDLRQLEYPMTMRLRITTAKSDATLLARLPNAGRDLADLSGATGSRSCRSFRGCPSGRRPLGALLGHSGVGTIARRQLRRIAGRSANLFFQLSDAGRLLLHKDHQLTNMSFEPLAFFANHYSLNA